MLFDDINEVRLLGNITNDPDLRFTPSGTPVLNFGMATNRRVKQNEQWTDEVTFHNVVAWSSLAQGVAQRSSKGTKVLVTGRLQVRTWDGTDGKKNYRTEVVADNIILIDRYNKAKADELPPVSASSGKPTSAGSNDSNSSSNTGGADLVDTSIDPDDLPF